MSRRMTIGWIWLVPSASKRDIGTSAPGSGLHVVGSCPLVRSDGIRKRRVEQVTGLPFAFELAVA